MNLRTLGRTGLQISELGFGCGPTAALMISAPAAQRREAIAFALDHGINYFDTAPGYGDSRSETHLGEALRELNARPFIATKVALRFDQLDDIVAAIRESVEASLQRLGVAEITVIQLHNRIASERAPKAPFGTGAVLNARDVLDEGGVVDAFERLRSRGLVRYFGCTAFGGEMEVVKSVIDSDAFDVLTMHYSLLNDTAWTAKPRCGELDYAGTAARAAARDMGTVALRVLEGGKLTPAGGEVAEQLQQRWADSGVTLTEAGIRFALTNAQLSSVLIGFSSIEQIEQALLYSERGPLPSAMLERTMPRA